MIRFKPSYCTTASDKENYGLKKNKHVKQAYINYTRDGMPSNIAIVASASYLGDYFVGGDGSTMWLDDLELVYE